jgi:hypothetical protein
VSKVGRPWRDRAADRLVGVAGDGGEAQPGAAVEQMSDTFDRGNKALAARVRLYVSIASFMKSAGR